MSKIGQEKATSSTGDFADVLECPVCMKIPNSTPIFQCKAGHIVCNACHPKLKKCPVCRESLGDIRSRVGEAIISRLLTACQFEGCTMELKKDDLKEHEKECQFRLVWCVRHNCKKQFPLVSLMEHIAKDHQDEVVHRKGSQFYEYQTLPYPLNIPVLTTYSGQFETDHFEIDEWQILCRHLSCLVDFSYGGSV